MSNLSTFLKEIEARAAAATPGPWTKMVHGAELNCLGDSVLDVDVGYSFLNPSDVPFIAHSREDIP